jgi:Arc/MetJ-type ribon-helix-helix transcriptional regulator
MTKVAKITVSLPQEQVEQVREAVARGEAVFSLSYE